MTENKPTSRILSVEDAEQVPGTERPQGWNAIWERIIRLGLGDAALRLGTGLALLILVLLVAWMMGNTYQVTREQPLSKAALAAPLAAETMTPTPQPIKLQPFTLKAQITGITRLAALHTILPTRPRFEVVEYEVVKGDTVEGIAKQFNLSPRTILNGNYETLADNPHLLLPGQKLNILPVDGVYHQWKSGEGLNGVAKYYKVDPSVIVDWPGNGLSKDTIGEYSNPNIPVGTWLVVPGGSREFVSWSAPRITRSDPAVAKVLGPGYCGTITDGPIGDGIMIWPTTATWLSGYDYAPDSNHPAIDIAGQLGNAIYAVDDGVVVYSGWNNWGYGNVIVIDHGNGWQSLYAHLSGINIGCNGYVYQGSVIGLLGSTGNSTGPHLHFELISDLYGKVNPWNFLVQ